MLLTNIMFLGDDANDDNVDNVDNDVDTVDNVEARLLLQSMNSVEPPPMGIWAKGAPAIIVSCMQWGGHTISHNEHNTE